MAHENECPYKPETASVPSSPWYEPTKRTVFRGAAAAVAAISAASIWNAARGNISSTKATALVAASAAGIYSGALVGHSYLTSRQFTHSAGQRIPVHGPFRTMYDLIVRKKTQLRDIDLERQGRYGDIYVMYAGAMPIVVVTSSDLAEEVSTSLDIFNKSDPRELGMPFYFQWVGNNNVVLSNGDEWKRIRSATNPALASVHLYTPTFHEKAQILCAAFDRQIRTSDEAGESQLIYLQRWLKAMSLDTAGVALFDYDFKHLSEMSNPAIDAMDFVVNEVFNPLRRTFPIMNKLPLKSTLRLQASMDLLDGLVEDMIESLRSGQHTGARGNVLEMLTRGRDADHLDRDELRNNIIAMVLASHETTQVSLGGILYFLAKFPERQEKLRAEACALFPDLQAEFDTLTGERNEAYRKLQAFESLDNFILESMRLYSPLANQNPRTTMTDTSLGGYSIPQGTIVSINIHAVHMSGSEWTNPTEFDPDRHETESNKFSYLPFGAGARICAGKNFSLIEQKIVICHILRRFRIELPDPAYQVPLDRASFTGLHDHTYHLRFTALSSSDSTLEAVR